MVYTFTWKERSVLDVQAMGTISSREEYIIMPPKTHKWI